MEALDVAYMLRRFISELLGVDPEFELFTDKKNMIDAINTTNLMVDKRLRVDIAALREMNENNEVCFK